MHNITDLVLFDINPKIRINLAQVFLQRWESEAMPCLEATVEI